MQRRERRALVVIAVQSLTAAGCLGGGGPSGGTADAGAGAGVTGLAHFDGDGYGFDYPAAWTFQPFTSTTSFFTVKGYLGNDPVAVANVCQTTGNGTVCHFQPAGHRRDSVVIEIAMWGAPMSDPIEPWLHPTDGRPVRIGGMPGVAGERHDVPGHLGLTWKALRPDAFDNWVQLDADVAEPLDPVIGAQLEALIASFRFVPAPAALDPSAAAGIAQAGLATLKAEDAEGYACYPPAGRSVDAVVTKLPMGPFVSGLQATCSTSIAASPIGYWRLDMTVAWPQTGGVAAGQWTTTQWFTAAGGRLGETGSGDTPPTSP